MLLLLLLLLMMMMMMLMLMLMLGFLYQHRDLHRQLPTAQAGAAGESTNHGLGCTLQAARLGLRHLQGAAPYRLRLGLVLLLGVIVTPRVGILGVIITPTLLLLLL
jgi:hypothetical protein